MLFLCSSCVFAFLRNPDCLQAFVTEGLFPLEAKGLSLQCDGRNVKVNDKLICAFLYYCTFHVPIFGFTEEEILSFDPSKHRKELAIFWFRYYNNLLEEEVMEKLEECL